MKLNLLVVMFLIVSYTTSLAQSEAGSIVVGGGFGFSTQKSKTVTDAATTESDPTVNFNFSPRIGYFMAEDLELGINLAYTVSSTGDSDYKFVNSSLSFAPYARKYFSLGETVYAFGQGSLSFGSGKIKSKTGGETTKTDDYGMFAIGIAPGLMIRPTDRIGLEFTAGFLGYNSYTDKNPGGLTEEVKSSGFGFTFNLSSINFGIRIFL